ncbi:MAG: hypothetical protein HYR63_23465 [Proteobacteria bacterium]|nr:hypothetical protein [Pseudomonadota bacterium]
MLAEARIFHGRASAVTAAFSHLYDLGNACLGCGRPRQASLAYRRALVLAPAEAPLLSNAGEAMAALGSHETALAWHRRALCVSPDASLTMASLVRAWTRLGSVDNACRAARQTVSNTPSLLAGLINAGLAIGTAGQRRSAELVYRRALALDADSAEARFALASARLSAGDLIEGFKLYEARFNLPAVPVAALSPGVPIWSGETRPGLRLLLHCEQGYGDSIHFIRYALLLARRGLKVWVRCPEPLLRLFAQLQPTIRLCRLDDRLPEVDAQAALMSVPFLLATDLATIPAEVPYLAPGLTQASKTPTRKRRSRKIGIAWAGRPEQMSDRMRSMPVTALSALVAEIVATGDRAFSLQVGPRRSDLTEIAGSVVDLGQSFQDFADTAAALAELDLTIAVDSAVGHLAGALALPVWLLLAYVPEWRWLEGRPDSPWYPTMRLFRQPTPGNWSAMIADVGRALRELAVDGR